MDHALPLLRGLAGCAPAADEVDVDVFTLPASDVAALTQLAVGGRAAKAHADWRTLWAEATDAALPPDERLHAGALPRALEMAMRGLRRTPSTAAGAAVAYSALLATPGAPFHALFTPMAFEAMLRVLRELTHADNATAAAASKAKKGKKPAAAPAAPAEDEDAMDIEEGVSGTQQKLTEKERSELPESMMRSLTLALAQHPFNTQLEALRSAIDALAAVACGCPDDPLRELAVKALKEAMQHAPLVSNAALMFMRLTPTFFQTAAVRTRSLKLVQESCRAQPQMKVAAGALLRKLCTECPDRSEPRAAAVTAVLSVLTALGTGSHVAAFAAFLLTLSKSSRMNWRVMAVEVAAGVLQHFADPFELPGEEEEEEEATKNDGAATPMQKDGGDEAAEEETDAQAMMMDVNEDHHVATPAPSKRQPKKSAVRVQAWGLSCMTALVARCTDKAPSVRSKALQALAAVIDHFADDDAHCPEVLAMLGVTAPTAGAAAPIVTFPHWLPHVRRSTEDEKALVRRAAVQAVEAVAVARRTLQPEDCALVVAASADALLSVRRQAMTTASRLLSAFPADVNAVRCWLQTVLPLATDVEVTLQEKCTELFREQVLVRLESAAKRPTMEAASAVGPLLSALGAVANAERCVQRVMTALAKKGLLGKTAATALQTLATAEGLPPPATESVWMLLAELAMHCPEGVTWEFLQAQWERSLDNAGALHVNLLLRTVAAAASRFPAAAAAALADRLLANLKTLTLPPPAAAAHIAALANLCKHKSASAAEAEAVIAGWAGLLLDAAAEPLGGLVLGTATAGAAPDPRLVTALFMVGELSMLTASAAPGQLLTFTQALLKDTLELPAGVGDEASGVRKVTVPADVRAHAWTALGKACLVDEPLAKRTLPFFVQQLQACDAAAVRNNILVALADLCTRYTGLVEPHAGRLAACLRDRCVVIRRHALLLLATLLSRDFLKWRGLLFQRFLLALVDESPHIRQLADYLLGDALATKAPLLAYNHFVEALFMLNDCRLHPSYTSSGVSAGASEKERVLFSLVGSTPVVRAQRRLIYEVLARRLSPEHRLATTAKITQEVLGAVVDETLPFAACAEVVHDALAVVGMKEMKVSVARNTGDEDVEEDAAATAMADARGKLVSSIMKKNLMENVVPTLIELRALLTDKRSPLAGTLMATLRVLLKDYKSEIADLLACDKQLARELLYDIQQSEAAEKAAAEVEAAAAALREESQGMETQATAMDTQTPASTRWPAVPVGVDCAATPSAAAVLTSVAAEEQAQGDGRRTPLDPASILRASAAGLPSCVPTTPGGFALPTVRASPQQRRMRRGRGGEGEENRRSSQLNVQAVMLDSPCTEVLKRQWNIPAPDVAAEEEQQTEQATAVATRAKAAKGRPAAAANGSKRTAARKAKA